MNHVFQTSARTALAAVLAVCLFLAVGSALADTRNASFWMQVEGEKALYPQSMAAVGDAVYMLADGALYRYRPGDQAPEAVLKDLETYQWVEKGETAQPSDALHISHLFVWEGALYGVSLNDGTVTCLTDDAGQVTPKKVCTLDASAVAVEDTYVSQVFAAHGKLYVLCESQTQSLYAFALEDGAAPAKLSIENAVCLGAYQNGLLVGITRPYLEDGDPNARVFSYDPSTGAQETLLDTGKADYAFGVAYIPETDTLYVGMDSRVYTYTADGGKPGTAAYLPERCQSFALFDQNSLMAVQGYTGMYIRDLSQGDLSSQVLIIAGEYGTSEHMAVVREHPEMVISPNSDYVSDIQTLTASMVSGESSMDVLKLSPEYQPVEDLIDKGYSADLSVYPEIMAVADQMDPRFLTPFRRDGKLYALPVSVYIQTVSVNQTAWTEELGLSLDELPKTYLELLDFISNYTYDYGDDHPDLALTDSWDLRSELLTMLLQAECVYQMRESANGFTFDTPRFHKLVAALDAIDYSDISLKEILGMDATDDDYNDFYSKQQLFSLYYGVSGPECYKEHNAMTPLVLTLEEGLEPVLPAALSVLLINTKSAHPDLAAQYVASYANHLSPATQGITLFPERNEEVPNPDYERSLRDAKNWLEDRRKALETVAPENRATLAQEVEDAEHWVEAAEKERLLLTKEEIARYRERICPYLMPLSGGAVIAIGGGQTDASIRTLLDEYAQRAIDGDAFIRELDNRVRLQLLENQ